MSVIVKYHQTIPWLILLSVGVLIMACGSSPDPVETVESAVPIRSDEVIPRGKRVLSIDINEPANGDYDQAFAMTLETGSGAVSLSIPWDIIETSPGEYHPDPNYLAIANLYYPASDIPVSLMIGPIDTNNLRVPSDLADIQFDDPMMISRFKAALDFAFTQIPDLELTVLDPAIVHEKATQLTNRYPDKPIFFMELGYPSSPRLNSSE
jgi:hypothetical protein